MAKPKPPVQAEEKSLGQKIVDGVDKILHPTPPEPSAVPAIEEEPIVQAPDVESMAEHQKFDKFKNQETTPDDK